MTMPDFWQELDELPLSVWVLNCFEAAGIETIGQLIARSDSDLLELPRFGRKCLNEGKDALKGLGLYLDYFNRRARPRS